MISPRRLLFICSRNRLRSPTGEHIFRAKRGFETASAGLSPDAEEPVTPELVEWADIIFVMERKHRAKLVQKFAKHLRAKRVVCLDIRDDYDFMEPALVEVLERRVVPFLE